MKATESMSRLSERRSVLARSLARLVGLNLEEEVLAVLSEPVLLIWIMLCFAILPSIFYMKMILKVGKLIKKNTNYEIKYVRNVELQRYVKRLSFQHLHSCKYLVVGLAG